MTAGAIGQARARPMIPRRKYLFTLFTPLTPAEAHDEALDRRNTADFGLVIRTLKPRGD